MNPRTLREAGSVAITAEALACTTGAVLVVALANAAAVIATGAVLVISGSGAGGHAGSVGIGQ